MGRQSTGTAAGSSGGGSVTQGTSPWVDNITQVGGSALALGQALAAASLPVVLTAAQITTLTPVSKAEDAAHTTGDSGVPVLGVRESTPTDLSAGATNGDYEPFQVDANGAVWISLATLIAGEDLTNNVLKVEQRFSFLNIAAGQATTTVKSGAGFLHSITFNSAATATNVTTVYDNTAGSGTVIAIPAATTATVPTTLTYDCSFSTGLTIVTGTANGSNMTVSYR